MNISILYLYAHHRNSYLKSEVRISFEINSFHFTNLLLYSSNLFKKNSTTYIEIISSSNLRLISNNLHFKKKKQTL